MERLYWHIEAPWSWDNKSFRFALYLRIMCIVNYTIHVCVYIPTPTSCQLSVYKQLSLKWWQFIFYKKSLKFFHIIIHVVHTNVTHTYFYIYAVGETVEKNREHKGKNLPIRKLMKLPSIPYIIYYPVLLGAELKPNKHVAIRQKFRIEVNISLIYQILTYLIQRSINILLALNIACYIIL